MCSDRAKWSTIKRSIYRSVTNPPGSCKKINIKVITNGT